MNNKSLSALRADFDATARRSISMPLAGALVWTALAIASFLVPARFQVFVVLYGTGVIFPVALAIGAIREENILARVNPLNRLMGLAVLMVNLLWVLHIPLAIWKPEFVVLSLGVGLGIHWIIFGWIINHPLGLVHAIMRSLLAVAAWVLFPEHRIAAVAATVVLSYLVSLVLLMQRPLNKAD